MLAFCQGMAFATMAGLPLVYGVMCAAVAAMIGPGLASSKHTVLGPTNGSAFLIFSYFAVNPYLSQIQHMPLLVLMTGILLIIGAFFKVADLAQYISRTVVVAYVTGAAIMIFANQLTTTLGIHPNLETDDTIKALHGTLLGSIWQIVSHLDSIHLGAVLVSACTIAAYFLFKRYRPQWPGFMLSLIVGALVGVFLRKIGFEVETYKDAAFGWQNLIPPWPTIFAAGTAGQFSQLFGLALAVAFVSNLENSVMSKTLASKGNYRVDSNQDMLALGVSNVACAYFSGMPASGSLTRSALNYEAGAKTGISSIVSGFLCLLGALFLGDLVPYLPKAALAALVVCVSIALINRRNIRVCLRATRSDAFVFLVTFLATLVVPLHVAIFTGVGVSIILYLRKASQPHLVEYIFNQEGVLAEMESRTRNHPSISIVHVEGDLFFGAAELFRTQIQRISGDPNLKVIILRLKNARHLDATSVMALEELIRVMRDEKRDLIVSGAMRDVYRVLRDSGLIHVLGRENIFMGSAVNPNISTRNALKRAQEIIGAKDADIHIYYDPRHASKSNA